MWGLTLRDRGGHVAHEATAGGLLLLGGGRGSCEEVEEEEDMMRRSGEIASVERAFFPRKVGREGGGR